MSCQARRTKSSMSKPSAAEGGSGSGGSWPLLRSTAPWTSLSGPLSAAQPSAIALTSSASSRPSWRAMLSSSRTSHSSTMRFSLHHAVGDDAVAQLAARGRAVDAEAAVMRRAGDAVRGVVARLVVAAPDHVVGEEPTVGEHGERLHRAGHDRLDAVGVPARAVYRARCGRNGCRSVPPASLPRSCACSGRCNPRCPRSRRRSRASPGVSRNRGASLR